MAIKKDKLKQQGEANGNNGTSPPIDLYDMLDSFTLDVDATRNENQRIQALEAEKAALEDEVSDLRDLAVRAEQGALIDLGRCQLTPVGLRLPDDLSHEEWAYVGEQLFQIEGSLQWMIGDWLAFAERKEYGQAKDIAQRLGKNPGTLHNWAWVSREMDDVAQRHQDLSHTHHLTVVSLENDPSRYAQWLSRAAEGDVINQTSGERRAWSVSRLKAEMKSASSPAKPSRKASKSAQLSKQMAEVARLYSLDPDKLRPAQRKAYLRKIDALRAVLDDLGSRIAD